VHQWKILKNDLRLWKQAWVLTELRTWTYLHPLDNWDGQKLYLWKAINGMPSYLKAISNVKIVKKKRDLSPSHQCHPFQRNQ